MAPSIFKFLAAFTYVYLPQINAAPSHPRPRGAAFGTSPNPENYLLGRQDSGGDAPDIGDLSFVKSYSAIGDSYAAGIGAGEVLGGSDDSKCSRYDLSYPALVNYDDRLGDSSSRQFTFSACSGALTDAVINDQLPKLPGNQDLITISIGGNDLGLINILNGCIFQWNPTASCQSALDEAQKIVNSDDLSGKFDQILSAAREKLSGNGMIYWTGYAHFWGTDDNQCDSITWSFWYNLGNREYLTLERRKTMNSLVDQLNGKISDAINRSGNGQAVFIDYAQYYDTLISRFCEAGYPETDPNRVGLAFYQWDTDDNADADSLEPRDDSNPPMVLNGTVDGMINELIQEGLQSNPDLQTDQIELAFRPPPGNTSLATVNNTVSGIASNSTRRALVKRQTAQVPADLAAEGFVLSSIPVPDSYGKIFHPRAYGYAMIKNLIIYEMTATNAKRLSQEVPDVAFNPDTCTLNQAPKDTCNQNSASSVPAKMLGADDKELSPNDVLFALRDTICNNKCELPAALPSDVGWAKGTKTDGDCEIAVSIQGGVEAYMYRGTPSEGDQWQQCWDLTQNIINSCVNNGPNEGWVNGGNDFQFYQAGFRSLNGQGSIHSPISGNPLKSGTAPGGIVGPDNIDSIKCGQDANVGTTLSQCTNLINGLVGSLFSLSDSNTTQGICTDSDFCLSKGESMSSDGKTDLGPYCEVLSNSGCSFVLATKKSDFGFPGKGCVSPAQVNQYLRTLRDCPGDDAWAAQYTPDRYTDQPYLAVALVGDHAAASVYA